MVMVLSQDIPSDKEIYYRRSLIEALDKAGYQYGTYQYAKRQYGPSPSQLYNNRYHDNKYHGRTYGANLYQHLSRVSLIQQMQFVRKRMPHIMPTHQNDSESSPSKAQRKVREAFKRSCDCFNIQPWSGGAEPDGYGGYSRTWWYDQAGPSGLWYYDYFIQQTWAHMFADDPPKWCTTKSIEDTWVEQYAPDTNHSGDSFFCCNNKVDDSTQAYIKTNMKEPQLLYIHNIYGFEYHKIINVYAITEEYNTNSITWNTKPALGELIGSFDTYNETTQWHKVPVGGHNSICLTEATQTDWWISWRSSDSVTPAYRPYFAL